MPPPHGFTFYADLLGIGAAYRLSPNTAHQKLNKFYNIVFSRLRALCVNDALRVNLYSDSVLVWGDNPSAIIKPLQDVYINLFEHKLLLRGAMVEGKVEREPRLEVKNLQKFLPVNDSLARAVGLEQSVKGARFLISPRLGERLLSDEPEWRTVEGYVDHAITLGTPFESLLRRICPLPQGTAYELLYFWLPRGVSAKAFDYKSAKSKLREISIFLGPTQAIHYRETIGLIDRCQRREQSTRRAFAKEG